MLPFSGLHFSPSAWMIPMSANLLIMPEIPVPSAQGAVDKNLRKLYPNFLLEKALDVFWEFDQRQKKGGNYDLERPGLAGKRESNY